MGQCCNSPHENNIYTEININNAALANLIAGHLDRLGWNQAKLAKASGLSKATVSRLMAYSIPSDRRPMLETIMAVALALKLSREEAEHLFQTAFPESAVWDQAIEQRMTVDEANIILSQQKLPLLTNFD